MARQTRLEIREGNRAKLMAAARIEFAERGYRETKVDAVAARAGLTRGAVYSNFPSKRALYFAVLADDAEAEAAEIENALSAGAGSASAPSGGTPALGTAASSLRAGGMLAEGTAGSGAAGGAARSGAADGTAGSGAAGGTAGSEAAGSGAAEGAAGSEAAGSEVAGGTLARGMGGRGFAGGAVSAGGVGAGGVGAGGRSAGGEGAGRAVRTGRGALGALARDWVARLPLATAPTHLRSHLLPEVMADERTRHAYTQLMKIAALQIGVALGRVDGAGVRVRQAEAALTVLEGARQLAAAAPGLVEPFHVVQTCEGLPEFDRGWDFPEHLPPTSVVDEPWAPGEAFDVAHGVPADLGTDGVVAVMGVQRLAGVEAAVRGMPDSEDVTLVVVATDPGEVMGLARLVITETRGYLRRAFPPAALPRLRVVLDPAGTIAAAAGVDGVGDTTEVAIAVRDGRIRLRSTGLAACAATTLHHTTTRH